MIAHIANVAAKLSGISGLAAHVELEAREADVPALLVPVARGLVGELAVREGELRTAILGMQLHRDEALALRRAVPRPRVDELRRRIHLAVDAPHVELLAIGLDHHD